MLISVIVPCYNQKDFIGECLDSVLAQTYSEWECIVVNDGSTDDSASIVESYCAKDHRFKLFNRANGGVSAARNLGISKATGFLILPLDGDDRIGEHYFSEAAAVFAKSPDTALVYAEAKLFGEITKFWPLPEYSYNKLLFQNCIYCSAFYKREAFLRTAGYDESMKQGYEDWEFWVSLLDPCAKVVQLNSIQFYYRQRNNSRNSFKDDEAVHKSVLEYIFRKHYRKYLMAVGLEDTMESFRNRSETLEKSIEFSKSISYRTIYKGEKEWRRFLNRFR